LIDDPDNKDRKSGVRDHHPEKELPMQQRCSDQGKENEQY
jgi:hypothetical protein